jgi:hypothetical protein
MRTNPHMHIRIHMQAPHLLVEAEDDGVVGVAPLVTCQGLHIRPASPQACTQARHLAITGGNGLLCLLQLLLQLSYLQTTAADAEKKARKTGQRGQHVVENMHTAHTAANDCSAGNPMLDCMLHLHPPQGPSPWSHVCVGGMTACGVMLAKCTARKLSHTECHRSIQAPREG